MDETQHEVTLGLGQEAAFGLFTAGLERWWPPEYTWGQDACVRTAMECYAGGFLHEIGPHGFRTDWGRILRWDPPRLLTFSWQIMPDRTPQPDPAKSSEVAVAFVPEGAHTRVLLAHRHFRRHGERGEDYREEMGSQMGWPLLLARYARMAGTAPRAG